MPKESQFDRLQILRAIRNHLVHRGSPPTIEELRKALGVGSTRTVLRYLQLLEEAGDIDRWAGARGIRLRRSPDGEVSTRAVPLVGEVPAGPLMAAEENWEGCLRLPTTVAPASGTFFLLRVRGDSMNRAKVKGDLIEDGDLVLVRQQATALKGDVVVALIDGQATVKRFATGPGYYVLKPESSNREHHPILLEDEFAIQGVVTKVVKSGQRIAMEDAHE